MQTFTGFEYIKIDIANAFGMDKALFEERIQWVDDNINDLESLLDEADDAPLFLAGVMALRDAQNGKPTGHMVGLDACSSGIQIMGTLIGCPVTCANTGLVDPDIRSDIYTTTTEVMNDLLKEEGITVAPARSDVKSALMTTFYGSRAQPIKIFGKDTVEVEKFYEAAYAVAPGACDVMEMLLGAWQPFALSHEWVLPDGFEARCKVMEPVDCEFQVEECGVPVRFTHRFYENKGTESGLSIAANLVHSVDGMIVREVNRRCNYDPEHLRRVLALIDEHLPEDAVATEFRDFISLRKADEITSTTISTYSTNTLVRLKKLIESVLQHKPFPVVTVHDEFKCHPNNMNWLRMHYIDIFCELGDSDLLSDLLSQVTGKYQPVYKVSNNISSLIAQSNYALS